MKTIQFKKLFLIALTVASSSVAHVQGYNEPTVFAWSTYGNLSIPILPLNMAFLPSISINKNALLYVGAAAAGTLALYGCWYLYSTYKKPTKENKKYQKAMAPAPNSTNNTIAHTTTTPTNKPTATDEQTHKAHASESQIMHAPTTLVMPATATVAEQKATHNHSKQVKRTSKKNYFDAQYVDHTMQRAAKKLDQLNTTTHRTQKASTTAFAKINTTINKQSAHPEFTQAEKTDNFIAGVTKKITTAETKYKNSEEIQQYISELSAIKQQINDYLDSLTRLTSHRYNQKRKKSRAHSSTQESNSCSDNEEAERIKTQRQLQEIIAKLDPSINALDKLHLLITELEAEIVRLQSSIASSTSTPTTSSDGESS